MTPAKDCSFLGPCCRPDLELVPLSVPDRTFFFKITVWQILGCYGTEIQAFPPFKCNVKQYSDIYLPSFLPLLQDRVLSMSAIPNVPTLKPALLTGHLGLGGVWGMILSAAHRYPSSNRLYFSTNFLPFLKLWVHGDIQSQFLFPFGTLQDMFVCLF